MPLSDDCSEEGISATIAKLVREGKPQDQAVAIAYSNCGKAKLQTGVKALVNTGSLIKAVTPDTFEGYLVRYGRNQDKDLDGEWFDNATYFMREAGYPIKGAPVNYQHGMEPQFGNLGIGLFDFVSEDEIGLFVRAQLNTKDKYVAMLRELGRVKGVKIGDAEYVRKADLAFKAVQDLIHTLPLRQSMGADIATFRANEDTGHIDQCGIVHGALTPTPSDDKNPLVKFKSALDYVYDLQSTTTYSIPKTVTTADSGGVTINVYQGDVQAAREDSVSRLNLESAYWNNAAKDNPMTSYPTQELRTMKLRKPIKAMSPEEQQMFMDEIMACIQDLFARMGGAAPGPEAMQTMAAEMAANLDQTAPDQTSSDQANATSPVVDEAASAIASDVANAADAQPAGEPVTEEQVAQIVQDNLDQILPDSVKRYFAEQAKAATSRKSAVERALKAYQQEAPAISRKSIVGGFRQERPVQISVEEERKYMTQSAEEMALGLKVMAAFAARSMPPQMVKKLKLNDLVSEGYARSMAHKIAQEVKSEAGFKAVGQYDNAMKFDRHFMKSAMPFKADELDAIAITNQGAEWAYIFYDTRLWERARHETQLFNLLVSKGMRTADVTGHTMDVKLNTGSPTLYTAPESRSVDATGLPEVVVQTTPFATNNVQVDIVKHMLATSFSDELDEDSLIAIQSFLDQDLVMTVAEGIESAIINGDTTATSSNINTDSTPASGIQTPLYIAWDGLRHHALVDNTSQGNAKGAALELIDFERTINLFDATISNRRDKMLFIVDRNTQSQIRRLPELLTDDVKKSGGTAFGGPIGPLFEVDLYMSGFLGTSLATGYISDTTESNVYGQILCVYAPYWQFGRKRDVMIELDRHPQRSATVVVASVRHILVDRGSDAATMTYDLTVSS